jgi:spore coat-associated protein N
MTPQTRNDRSSRRLTPRLGAGLAALAILLVAAHEYGPGRSPRTKAVSSEARGRLSLSNSRDGSAIFTASRMAPGQWTAGAVTITNTGTEPGSLVLSHSNLVDTLGLGGGQLSERLDLQVREISDGRDPSTLYAGKVGAMTPRPLGQFAPGEARTYSFTVSLPDGGAPASLRSGDNAYMASSMSLQYDWRVVSTESRTEPPIGPRDLTPPRLRLRFPQVQRVVRRRHILVHARCSEACRLSMRGRVPYSNAGKQAGFGVVRRELRARTPVRLRLKLSGRALASVRRALHPRGRIALGLRATAMDRAGNRATVRHRLWLRRR